MSLSGLIVGWRIHSGLGNAVAGYALMIAFSFAVIWLGVLMAAAVGTPEAVQGIGFVFIFPLTFIASTFVPTSTLPSVLRQIAEWNPVSAIAGALRHLFGNPGAAAAPDAPWSLQHPIAYSLIWVVGIVVVCAPLAVRMFQRSIAS
jgi:ABC-2 type transport system permease protein